MKLLFLVGGWRQERSTADLSPLDILSTSRVYNHFLRREIERITDWKTMTYRFATVQDEAEARRFLTGYTPPPADHVICLEQRGFAEAHQMIFDFFKARTPGAVCAICDHNGILGPEDYLFHVQPTRHPESTKSVQVTWAASPEYCYPDKQPGTLNLLIDHRNYAGQKDRAIEVAEQVAAFAERRFPVVKDRLGFSTIAVRQFVSGGIAEVNTCQLVLENSYNRRGLPYPDACLEYRRANVFFVTKPESMGLSVLECAMAGALVVVPKGYVPNNLLAPLNHVIWDKAIDWDEVEERLDVGMSARSAAPFNWQQLATLFLNTLRLHPLKAIASSGVSTG